eukprot:TRINITY_DN10307_c1_g1_i8.p1 TRINITY_DN10307_c1_g1~~TRINITY_DN10307_c1_g1_i8.p1  ORF type:complete len:522 (+),score=122.68 TRINITY_DN10307_c1_g1_i8:218-1783(+)
MQDTLSAPVAESVEESKPQNESVDPSSPQNAPDAEISDPPQSLESDDAPPSRLRRKRVQDDEDEDEELNTEAPAETTLEDLGLDIKDDDDLNFDMGNDHVSDDDNFMIVKRRKTSEDRNSDDDEVDMRGFSGLEEDTPVTFEDVFGDTFHEYQFKSHNMYNRKIDSLVEEMQNRVERIEQVKERATDLREAFGDDELVEKLLGEPIAETSDVHAVSTISAPGGLRLNCHGGKSKFDIKNASYLTTMPTIHNYQCLHLPITGPESDRRIKTSGNPEVYEDRKPIQAGLHGAGQALPGAIYTPHNVIRWKKIKGKSELQSNARLLEYSNGDKFIKVGDDYFVVESHETPQENQHLMGAHGTVLLEYMKIRNSWRLRPLPKARGINNSTLDEESRKIREQTMPTLPRKKVKIFVEDKQKDASTIEEEYLRTYESMEDEVNPERVAAREAKQKELEEEEFQRLMQQQEAEDEADDEDGASIRSEDVVSELAEDEPVPEPVQAEDRLALAAMGSAADPVRQRANKD